MKYVYPAVFTPEDPGISVRFPDIKNCFTSGADPKDAMEMAADALCMMLSYLEETGGPIPAASSQEAIRAELGPGEYVSLVACDTAEQR